MINIRRVGGGDLVEGRSSKFGGGVLREEIRKCVRGGGESGIKGTGLGGRHGEGRGLKQY